MFMERTDMVESGKEKGRMHQCLCYEHKAAYRVALLAFEGTP